MRGCQLPLKTEQARYYCARGHSFDVARSGYLNLLQPQDRRSKTPGDTPRAVAARRRLHERQFTAPLLKAIGEAASTSSVDTVLDAGCGEGFYLANLQLGSGCIAHGTDISVPAIDAAARRYTECRWTVANADRFLPYADNSFTLLISITARMNPPEFKRVLKEGGRLLIAIPAPDDLIELRGAGRDRQARTIAEFAPYFRCTAQASVTTTSQLDREAVEDVLLAIYRPLQPKEAMPTMVTFSLQLLEFRA